MGVISSYVKYLERIYLEDAQDAGLNYEQYLPHRNDESVSIDRVWDLCKAYFAGTAAWHKPSNGNTTLIYFHQETHYYGSNSSGSTNRDNDNAAAMIALAFMAIWLASGIIFRHGISKGAETLRTPLRNLFAIPGFVVGVLAGGIVGIIPALAYKLWNPSSAVWRGIMTGVWVGADLGSRVTGFVGGVTGSIAGGVIGGLSSIVAGLPLGLAGVVLAPVKVVQTIYGLGRSFVGYVADKYNSLGAVPTVEHEYAPEVRNDPEQDSLLQRSTADTALAPRSPKSATIVPPPIVEPISTSMEEPQLVSPTTEIKTEAPVISTESDVLSQLHAATQRPSSPSMLYRLANPELWEPKDGDVLQQRFVDPGQQEQQETGLLKRKMSNN